MWINVNYLAILVAAVASFALGWLWYSPALFAKIWMSEMGMTPEKMAAMPKSGMAKQFSLSFLGGLIMAWVLAVLISRVGANSLIGGLKLGAFVWLGFIATVQMSDILFGGKSKKLYLINTGYNLVSLLLMGVILALWV